MVHSLLALVSFSIHFFKLGLFLTLEKRSRFLESLQKFACKMITKNWQSLDELYMTKLPSIPCRRKVLCNLSYFPPTLLYLKSLDHNYANTPFTFYQPVHILIVFFVPHSLYPTVPQLLERVISTPSLATFVHSHKYMH